jgi:hypothetical protein
VTTDAKHELVATQETERERLIKAAEHVRWWPGALGFLILGMVYALISEQLTVGPPWAPLVVVVLALIGSRLTRWRGLMRARRAIVVAALGVVALAVSASAAFLIRELVQGRASAEPLLRDAGLVWLANVLTFALLYWELDGGGPAHRKASHRSASAFAFPQDVLADSSEAHAKWMPEFVDYVFLAFNTSTAFSPTDTMVLGRGAKGLMMWQSLVSLISIAVLAARAINTI